MMHVVLVISSLRGGGAERVATTMAAGFVERGLQVTLVTLLDPSEDFYELPTGAARVALDLGGDEPGVPRAVLRNLRRLSQLTDTLRGLAPDLVVSFMDATNVLCVLACQRLRMPLIVSQRIDPARHDDGPAWRVLRRICYPLANHVVSISHGIDRRFDWIPETRRSVIHNPHVRRAEGNGVELPSGIVPGRFMIAIGRLTHQKGFDLLLRAFAGIVSETDWSLVIVGEGEERGNLEQLRDDLGLGDRAVMTGQLADPFPLLRQAGLFVLSSRYEGFGNVIIEAMDAGTPVLATDCPSGPAEIVESGVDGWLVPPEDIDALARGMQHAIARPEERDRLAASAEVRVRRFAVSRHLDRWQQLFAEVIFSAP